MKKAVAVFILLSMVYFLFAGCQTQWNPNTLYMENLSDELKEEISLKAMSRLDGAVNIRWDHYDSDFGYPYYGTINNCVIIRRVGNAINYGEGIPKQGHFEIAGYVFDWKNPFRFLVYHDGDICELSEAFELGWLTQEQIGKIHAKHTTDYAKVLQKRYEGLSEEPIAGNDFYTYHKSLTEAQKQDISKVLQTQCGVGVDWNARHTYYGVNNQCVILMVVHQQEEPSYQTAVIADQTFEWQYPFELYAYRNGEACTLQEAYGKGWVTQLGALNIRHVNIMYYAELAA